MNYFKYVLVALCSGVCSILFNDITYNLGLVLSASAAILVGYGQSRLSRLGACWSRDCRDRGSQKKSSICSISSDRKPSSFPVASLRVSCAVFSMPKAAGKISVARPFMLWAIQFQTRLAGPSLKSGRW